MRLLILTMVLAFFLGGCGGGEKPLRDAENARQDAENARQDGERARQDGERARQDGEGADQDNGLESTGGDDAQADNRAAAESQVKALEIAVSLYRMDIGTCPSDDEGLAVLIEAPADETMAGRWKGPYLSGTEVPMDPWGNPYVYRTSDDETAPAFEIVSFGADGREGGTGADADISSQSLD